MEIIRLGEDSLKISLPKDEASKYDFIADKSLDYEKSASLRELLEKAKKEVNFDLKSSVSVELYVAPDGECEIFVKRGVEKSIRKDKTPEALRKKAQRSIYAFDKLEKLLLLCNRLSLSEFSGKSQIYYDFSREKYYLALSGVDIRDTRYSYLTEYAKYIKPNFYLHLTEHAKCLANKNAVEIFSKLL